MRTPEPLAALLADMRAAEEKAREEAEDPWLRPRSPHLYGADAAAFLGLLVRAARTGLSEVVTRRL